ncbi:Ltp family lipoprotein [Halobacillus sp. A1]|uniref:Ltp family lipoprotein n=1 Tax=Halobacillus sp. A1 TaxID=2880262 RepID=UPI003531CBA8|nr:Ltp family lipoprotein [Halobacillus sp. A1]
MLRICFFCYLEADYFIRPHITGSQKQAVSAAQTYLDYSSFSRQGLIDQRQDG